MPGSMHAPAATPATSRAALTLRLGATFLLETACMATYLPLFSLYMQRGLGMTPYQMSLVYATGPLMALFSPLVVGMVADRLLSAEKSLFLINLLRAAALYMAMRASSFSELLAAMACVGFCATPSLVLVNSITFHHLPDGRRIGHARVWGAASWIITVWGVSAYLERVGEARQLAELRGALGLSALIALLLAAYALCLPRTPPTRLGRGPLEALAALGMLRQRNFATLFAVGTISGALFQINVILQGLFFTSKSGLGLEPAQANLATSVSQLLELALFPLLALLLARFGLRTVLLVGIAAWPLRFAAYLAGHPLALVVGAQLLHGVSVVLGSMTMQIAVDELASRDRRASTQGLLVMGSAGVGALSGQLACGALLSSVAPDGAQNWPRIFAAPLLLGVLALAILALGFRGRNRS